ncbi:MAG: hypothetical protein AAF828_05060 [Bacteroidota bacterium]
MQLFLESDLQFIFPAAWTVRKYDEHHFYHALSGHGLKAVDFIALSPDGRLILVEVKNYCPRMDQTGTPYPVVRKKASQLAESLAKKYSDSLRAIRVVQQYYQRKWYYRLSYQLLRLLGSWGHFSELVFWNEAAKRSNHPIPVSIILWLETPKAAKKYRTKIYAHLTNHLDPAEAQLLLGGNGFSPLPDLRAHRK